MKDLERQLGKACTEAVGFTSADGKADGAGVVVGLGNDAGRHLLDDAHDVVHQGIGEGVVDDFLDKARLHLCMGDGIGGSLPISDNKSAGAEINAAIVSNDDDKDVGELVGVDLTEDGLACSR